MKSASLHEANVRSHLGHLEQSLMMRRLTVQTEITRHLDIALPMQARGYGKSRPIADNQYPDGSDNPDGRQRNRRVEIVVNTCI
jgi:flagellar motor protein MotB